MALSHVETKLLEKFLRMIELKTVAGKVILKGKDLDEILRLVHPHALSHANFTGVSITGASFKGAELSCASFHGATLVNCDFSLANLYGVSFAGATLSNCNFDTAWALQSNFALATLSNCDFSAANLAHASFHPGGGGFDLSDATIISLGYRWSEFVDKVVPYLLSACGKSIEEVANEKTWECHDWNNCPLRNAYGDGIKHVPLHMQEIAREFMLYFDLEKIPLERVLEGARQLRLQKMAELGLDPFFPDLEGSRKNLVTDSLDTMSGKAKHYRVAAVSNDHADMDMPVLDIVLDDAHSPKDVARLIESQESFEKTLEEYCENSVRVSPAGTEVAPSFQEELEDGQQESGGDVSARPFSICDMEGIPLACHSYVHLGECKEAAEKLVKRGELKRYCIIEFQGETPVLLVDAPFGPPTTEIWDEELECFFHYRICDMQGQPLNKHRYYSFKPCVMHAADLHRGGTIPQYCIQRFVGDKATKMVHAPFGPPVPITDTCRAVMGDEKEKETTSAGLNYRIFDMKGEPLEDRCYFSRSNCESVARHRHTNGSLPKYCIMECCGGVPVKLASCPCGIPAIPSDIEKVDSVSESVAEPPLALKDLEVGMHVEDDEGETGVVFTWSSGGTVNIHYSNGLSRWCPLQKLSRAKSIRKTIGKKHVGLMEECRKLYNELPKDTVRLPDISLPDEDGDSKRDEGAKTTFPAQESITNNPQLPFNVGDQVITRKDETGTVTEISVDGNITDIHVNFDSWWGIFGPEAIRPAETFLKGDIVQVNGKKGRIQDISFSQAFGRFYFTVAFAGDSKAQYPLDSLVFVSHELQIGDRVVLDDGQKGTVVYDNAWGAHTNSVAVLMDDSPDFGTTTVYCGAEHVWPLSDEDDGVANA